MSEVGRAMNWDEHRNRHWAHDERAPACLSLMTVFLLKNTSSVFPRVWIQILSLMLGALGSGKMLDLLHQNDESRFRATEQSVCPSNGTVARILNKTKYGSV